MAAARESEGHKVSDGTDPVLAVENITKVFPGVIALDGVSFHVNRHEVVGLIGENGAGKSTLLKVLTGIYQPDHGQIFREGEQVHFRNAIESANAGIGMVHQEQSLIGAVTVAENIQLGMEDEATKFGFYNWHKLNELAQTQLDKIHSDISPAAQVSSLSFARRQMVELAKALSVEERCEYEPVIILDEPTSVLEGQELETLFEQIDRLREIASVIFVSHRLEEVLRVSDRVYVLKDGKSVGEMNAKDADLDDLYRMMVGQASSEEYYHEDGQVDVAGAPVVLEVEGLGLRGAFENVSFKVRKGEILGIAGVIGSGREDLSRVLFGAAPMTSGKIMLNGKAMRFSGPPAAVKRGMGYIPAERRIEGIADGMSVGQNILLVDPAPAAFGPVLVPLKEKSVIRGWIERLRIKTPNAEVNVGNLSGGNQQKVVLAKWLNYDGLQVLLLDHPTRGLDVGAKEDVYSFVREQCARGVAVILLADSLEETIGLSNNIIVMRDGEVIDTFKADPGSKPTPVEIVERMV